MLGMAEQSIWMQKVEADPQHSHWYVNRFRSMARAGEDVVGEARLVDAMAPRGARILDAGCGPGRDYGFGEFFDDAARAGFTPDVLLSTWDLRPFTDNSDFLVAVLR